MISQLTVFTVCEHSDGKACVKGIVHRCSFKLASIPIKIPVAGESVNITLDTNFFNCLSVTMNQC